MPDPAQGETRPANGPGRNAHAPPVRGMSGSSVVTDPVCGMRVDRSKAVHMDFGGQRFYFCSHHCLHAFELSPQRHLDQRRLIAAEAKAAGLPANR